MTIKLLNKKSLLISASLCLLLSQDRGYCAFDDEEYESNYGEYGSIDEDKYEEMKGFSKKSTNGVEILKAYKDRSESTSDSNNDSSDSKGATLVKKYKQMKNFVPEYNEKVEILKAYKDLDEPQVGTDKVMPDQDTYEERLAEAKRRVNKLVKYATFIKNNPDPKDKDKNLKNKNLAALREAYKDLAIIELNTKIARYAGELSNIIDSNIQSAAMTIGKTALVQKMQKAAVDLGFRLQEPIDL